MASPYPSAQISQRSSQSSADGQAHPTPRLESALRRVSEFLRAHGVTDQARLQQLACAIVAACPDTDELPSAAVAQAQRRVDQFWQLALPSGGSAHPLWRRAFVEEHQSLFLGDVAAARTAVGRFGDPFSGEPPRPQPFARQQLLRMGVPTWLVGLLPPVLATVGLGGLMLHDLGRDGLSALELLWGLLFMAVFLLPAIGMTTSLWGFIRRRRPPVGSQTTGSLPRTAVLMPIYHEDTERVFATVAGMREALLATAQAECIELFVLSDSRDLQIAADEERAFRRVAANLENEARNPIYYRRRANNDRQKSGNLAEFLERFGEHYTYMIVLDADSLMSAPTMVELVRRMEDRPRLGLLQAALMLRNGRSLLARAQQFVTSVTGPLFMRGLAQWSGTHGNYYGHNAIVRVAAFMECAELPALSGPPPLGGHLLSHDFVEAALLCRGGYEVGAAWDLDESWEEMPQSVREYAARDRRWCQGNLQHLRIVLAQGLRPMSRIHFVVGALSFLTAPALLLFVLWGLLMLAVGAGPVLSESLAWVLLSATAVSLLAPRLLGLVALLLDPPRRRRHGGALRVTLSVLIEAVLSSLLAPVLIAHHTFAVLGILFGRTVSWGKQRGAAARSPLVAEALAHVPGTMLGLALLAGGAAVDPGALVFLLPCALPMALSIPIAVLFSHPRGGLPLRYLRLLSTPAELEPHGLMEAVEELRALTMTDAAARFRDVVLDPLLLSAHLDHLARRPKSATRSRVPEDLLERVLRRGPTALSKEEREQVLESEESMRFLHREAWRRWPVEGWDLSRQRPHLPTTFSKAARA